MAAPWHDLLLVAGFALAIRLVFLALTSDTYDYDEFVALLLGRDWAHGAVPYRDFMFFHPPGILVLTRALDPLFQLWWPSARVMMVLVDVGTAALIWRLGTELWGRRAGLASGAVYALSPVALISSVRVGEDPIITFLGVLGLFLLRRHSARWSVAAGLCLGLALWVKYPAAYFLPVYLLAAPRRFPAAAVTAAAAFGALMLPLHAEWNAVYQQTVVFQRSRWLMDISSRLDTTLLYWLGANAVAVIALLWWANKALRPRLLAAGSGRKVGTVAPVPVLPGGQGQEPLSLHHHRSLANGPSGHVRRTETPAVPSWALAGFLLGAIFLLNSQVYYHYFAVVGPFAALLSGWLLARASPGFGRILLVAGAGLALGWGVLLQNGGPAPFYVTAAHFSAIRPTIELLDRTTPLHGRVLADRFEYAYLADRPAVDQYFWNVGVLVGPPFLERRLPISSALVLSSGASSGFPAGFVPYLNAHFSRVHTATNTIWLLK